MAVFARITHGAICRSLSVCDLASHLIFHDKHIDWNSALGYSGEKISQTFATCLFKEQNINVIKNIEFLIPVIMSNNRFEYDVMKHFLHFILDQCQ